MTNPKAHTPSAGNGDANENRSTSPEHDAQPRRTRRTEVALKPATPLEVRVSRALDQELEWYFAYAEAALHRESVGILPSYAVVRILADGTSAALPRRGQDLGEPTDEACRARAHELARTVQGCLCRLQGRHASVLRAAYTPRRWPKPVENAFDILAPVAVRLAFANDPWPPRLSAHTGLEEAAAARLSATLRDPAKAKVAKIRTQAQRLLGNAVAAYAKARALKGGALGVA
jgi:hypothetical protein